MMILHKMVGAWSFLTEHGDIEAARGDARRVLEFEPVSASVGTDCLGGGEHDLVLVHL